jgi:hypothetical protein
MDIDSIGVLQAPLAMRHGKANAMAQRSAKAQGGKRGTNHQFASSVFFATSGSFAPLR